MPQIDTESSTTPNIIDESGSAGTSSPKAYLLVGVAFNGWLYNEKKVNPIGLAKKAPPIKEGFGVVVKNNCGSGCLFKSKAHLLVGESERIACCIKIVSPPFQRGI